MLTSIKNIPRNYISISDLIDDYTALHDDKLSGVISLLKSTKQFIVETSPDFKNERDRWITDASIAKILDSAGSELISFHKTISDDETEKNDIFNYCKLTILDRLELLQSMNDNIFTYYTKQPNSLKTALQL